MFRKRLKDLHEAMLNSKIHNLIISDPDSIFYFTGYKNEPGERFYILLSQSDGTVTLFLNRLFPPFNSSLNLDVIYYNDGEDITSVLTDKINSTKVGIDKLWPSHFLIDLMNKVPGLTPVNGSVIVDSIRGIKSPEEQDLMRQASAKNDQAMEYVLSILPDGLSEQDIASKLTNFYLETGHSGVSFEPIIAYGANGADPHHTTDQTMPELGHSVVIDIGGTYKDYASDMTRTVFYGEVSDKAREVYEIVKAANQAGIEAVKPGVKFCDIDRAARTVIEEAGYGEYFTHRTGHFIGLAVHEYGDVGPFNENECQVGQVFSIEPGIYLPGELGVRIEDLVLVTEDGCEVLNNVSKDLTIIDVN